MFYVESSALLAWLLGEAQQTAVAGVLDRAPIHVTSSLTLVECDRALHQGVAVGRLRQDRAAKASSDLILSTSPWTLVPFLPPILARARQRFPNEPIRALDALHVASALHAKLAHPQLAMLSLDERIRRVATALGFEVLPA